MIFLCECPNHGAHGQGAFEMGVNVGGCGSMSPTPIMCAALPCCRMRPRLRFTCLVTWDMIAFIRRSGRMRNGMSPLPLPYIRVKHIACHAPNVCVQHQKNNIRAPIRDRTKACRYAVSNTVAKRAVHACATIAMATTMSFRENKIAATRVNSGNTHSRIR